MVPVDTDTQVEIRTLDPATASDAEWEAVAALRNTLRAERLPDDPPHPAAQVRAQLQSIPSFVALSLWGAWAADGALVGLASLIVFRTEENQHLAQFGIEVLPAWRRRGIGRCLLAEVAARTAAEGRRTLIANSSGLVPAGGAFMRQVGAVVALEGRSSQLDLTTVDQALLDRWQADAATRAPGYTLGWWDGPYPEAELQAIAALREATNDQPLGDLEIEDIHMTPAQLRQLEAHLEGRGDQRWTAYVRAPETGALAGFTDVIWNPAQPGILEQGWTAIWPAHRGRGLGRLLKAAMLARALRERPEVRYVRTDNADANTPMLRINTDLGFHPYQHDLAWQVPLAQVQSYLAGGGTA